MLPMKAIRFTPCSCLDKMEEKMVRLRHVDGYEWVLAGDPTPEAAILKLSPSS